MNDQLKEFSACLKLIRWRVVPTSEKAKVVQSLESFTKAVQLDRIDWEHRLNKKLKTWHAPNDICIETDQAWLAGQGNYLLTMLDPQYPRSLLDLIDSPLALFVKGDESVLSTPQIAIVGSRSLTPTGEKIARDFSQQLARMGVTITSGLARGIDAAAHLATCQVGGKTIAVQGCGMDVIYPRQNQALAQMISASGCIISEFPIGTPPKRNNFPARNRLIAALSEGVLVVEAAIRSGSLITARLAAEQGKDVFAIPGSILSPQSRGCHWLIQQGAALIQSVEEMMFELKLPLLNKLEELGSEKSVSSIDKSTVTTCKVLESIDHHAVSFEQLVTRTDIDFQSLSQRLIELELDGLIARAHNGNYYRLT